VLWSIIWIFIILVAVFAIRAKIGQEEETTSTETTTPPAA
jgi:hypothetical protein